MSSCGVNGSNDRISISEAIYICKKFLYLMTGEDNKIILEINPIYKPNSETEDFYEFKIGTLETNEAGRVLVSASQSETPIPEFSLTGDSIFNSFRISTGKTNIRVIRFAASYYTCQDEKGLILGQLGTNSNINKTTINEFSNIDSKNLEQLNFTCSNRYQINVKEGTDYVSLKKEFSEVKKSDKEKEIAKTSWDFLFSVQDITNEEIQNNNIINAQAFPDITDFIFKKYRADGFENQSYFRQIPPWILPNATNHYSGCVGTAWMNFIGWHDLNYNKNILEGTNISNNNYINQLTMSVHNYLGTFKDRNSDSGLTYDKDIKRGLNFISKELKFRESSYSERYGVDGKDRNGYWVFDLVKEFIIEKKRPIIVTNNNHAAVAYEVRIPIIEFMEPYVRINTGWGGVNSPNNDALWAVSQLHGAYAVENFIPIISLSRLEEQQELEAQLSLHFNQPSLNDVTPKTIKINKMTVYNGIAVFDSLGSNSEAIYRAKISFLIGRNFVNDEILAINANGALASISNNGPSINTLYAVDYVKAYRDQDTGRIRVDIGIALSDVDSFLNRISYQVIIYSR